MIRLAWRLMVVVGMLAWAVGPGESPAQSMKKRAGTVVNLDGYKSQVFDYWKTPEKEKLEKPMLYRFTLPKGKDYKQDGEIIVKELESSAIAKDVFEEMKKQVKPPPDRKLEDIVNENEIKKDGPKISEVVVRLGAFNGDGKKDKEIADAKVIGAVVETKDKKYFVRLVGPRGMITTVQADLEQFLKDLKK
jgi:hypothetical protein